MSPARKTILALLSAAALFSAAARADDPAATAPMPKEFDILIARPMAQGDVYEIDEKKTLNRTMTKITADKKEETKEPRSLELAGVMVVAAADAAGQATEFTIKVKNFSGMGGGDEQRRIYVPEGTEITVKRTNKESTFTIAAAAVGDGTGAAKVELSDDAKLALTAIYPKVNTSQISDDQIFPSKGTRKVNDRWDADMSAIAAQAAGDGVKIDPKTSFGSATLLNARRGDSGVSLTIQTKIDAAIVSVASMPPNIKLVDSWMKAKNMLIIPANPKTKSYSQVLEETLEFKTNGTENGKPIVQTMVVYISHSQNITQVIAK